MVDAPDSLDKESVGKMVRALALELGCSMVGFSNVSDDLPQGLKKLPYAITIGIRLSTAIMEEIVDAPTYTYFNHYRSVNSLIDNILLRISLLLQNHGCKAYTIAASQTVPDGRQSYSGVFPHKTAAVKAGLGWIGKNGLLISEAYGPYVRLGTVLTDLMIEGCSDEIIPPKCGECRRCVDSCPALALTGNDWAQGCSREWLVDARSCSEYMNSRFKHIGRGSVCGICIRACPFGK